MPFGIWRPHLAESRVSLTLMTWQFQMPAAFMAVITKDQNWQMHGLSLLVFPGREESIRIEDMLRRVLRESQILREEKGSISHNMFTLKVINNTGFPVGLVVKNPPANAGDVGSIPGLGRSPGGGNGNPFQYSYLGNPMDRGAWRAIVHGVAKSHTRLSN